MEKGKAQKLTALSRSIPPIALPRKQILLRNGWRTQKKYYDLSSTFQASKRSNCAEGLIQGSARSNGLHHRISSNADPSPSSFELLLLGRNVADAYINNQFSSNTSF